MPNEQEVRVYARSDGGEPFTQWLRGLRDGQTRNRIRQRIARVRLGNFGDARSVGEGVHELRIQFGPGFRVIPYNDIRALVASITGNTVGFLVEPIQGEAGINVPDDGYLKESRRVCDEHKVLLMTDEIQTGLGRTGKLFCYEYEDVRPDVLIVGKEVVKPFDEVRQVGLCR